MLMVYLAVHVYSFCASQCAMRSSVEGKGSGASPQPDVVSLLRFERPGHYCALLLLALAAKIVWMYLCCSGCTVATHARLIFVVFVVVVFSPARPGPQLGWFWGPLPRQGFQFEGQLHSSIMRSLFVLCLVGVAQARLPTLAGTWSTYPNALPNLQLPHSPISGNGHLGVIVDASSTARNKSTAGPGVVNSLDVWLNTNSLWSCTSCNAGIDPDNVSKACCSVIALGGVSVRLTPTFATTPLPSFHATQTISSATLSTTFSTAAGSNVTTVTNVHPTLDAVVTNVTYTPQMHDPSVLVLDFATWVLGNGAISGSWNTGQPAPARVGCAAANGTEQICPGLSGGNVSLVFASRNASTDHADVMPLTAALATTVLLGPGAVLLGSAVTSYVPGPPSVPWEVTLRVSVPAGSWAAALTAEAETRGPGLDDPVPAALSLAAAGASAPTGFIADASAAWWADFWEASSVSLPTQPGAQALWEGAQYVLACSSSVQATSERPGPGLYGPWSTADGPNWHGDYTLE